jgi:hypothetical protein
MLRVDRTSAPDVPICAAAAMVTTVVMSHRSAPERVACGRHDTGGRVRFCVLYGLG